MKPISVKDPIWSEFHRLMRSHELNESELLELLMKEHEKPKEEKPMNEIEERNPTQEIKNNKLDFQIEKLSEVKELIFTTKELVKQLPSRAEITNTLTEIKKSLVDTTPQLKALEEKLKTTQTTLSEIKAQTSQKEINQKLDTLTLNLRTVNEKLTEVMEPPILEPEQIKTLTKLMNQWGRKNISETVQVLIESYYNQK